MQRHPPATDGAEGPEAPSPGTGGPRLSGPRAWFADRSVRTKLMALLAVFAVSLAAVAATSLSTLSKVDAASSRLILMRSAVDRPLSEAFEARTRAELLLSEYAAAPTEGQRESIATKITSNDATLDRAMGQFTSGTADLGIETPSWADAVRQWQTWRTLRDEEMIPALDGKDDNRYANLRTQDSLPGLVAMDATMAQAAEIIATDSTRLSDDVTAQNAVAPRTILVGSAAALVLVALLSFTTVRGITRPLSQVRRALSAMAEGDLTVRAEVRSRDEVGRMASELSTAQDALSRTLGEVSGVAATVAASGTRVRRRWARPSGTSHRTRRRPPASGPTRCTGPRPPLRPSESSAVPPPRSLRW